MKTKHKDQTTNMEDLVPKRDLLDPIRVAMQDEKLWHREKAMKTQHHIKHMACPCKLCKGSKKHMAMDTVGNPLIENGRHHSFQRWRGPSVRDISDDKWDDHIHGGGASFSPLLADMNNTIFEILEKFHDFGKNIV